MAKQSNYIVLILYCLTIIYQYGCSKSAPEIPKDFAPFITRITTPVKFVEIIPSHGGKPLPIPESLTRKQAFEDIQMLEYLFSTSYSGYDYWKYKGVDFESYFNILRKFVINKDTVTTYQFEIEISKILKQIYDGHISVVGAGYHNAYRHKSVYYSDLLVEKTRENIYKVIDSKFDMVKKGDLFTEEDAEAYLFKTLSAPGKTIYLVGVFTFDAVTYRDLSFNGKKVRVPFHGSRLRYAKFDDPEPFYIKRENNIPVVRVTSFADQLYPQMQKFMNSAKNLKNENTLIINLFYNGGGSSIFPQGFIQNLNGKIQWKTNWATLKSPAITEYYAKYDLKSMPDISPNFRNLIVSHKNMYEDYRRTPVKEWDFAATHDHDIPGSYSGRLILLTNRRVLSAGEGMVGVAKSVENCLIIGENTGGSAQFSSTCGFYLPHSKIIANLPRQFILIPGLDECVGYLPDYWLDTHEPVREVLKWLNNPDNYQFRYSNSYSDFTKKLNLSPALPADMNIILPKSIVPKNLAAFSGKWAGTWDGVLDHLLVVERVNANLEVDAIYSWGVANQWNINQPGWQRYKGKIEGNALVLKNKNSKIEITYKLNSDTTLLASYQRPGIFSRSILTKTDK